MNERSDQILREVLRNGNNEDAHRLLREFFSGYPVDNLRQLFESSDERVVKVGAWIASELGSKAASLKDSFFPLLDNQSRYVRFFILDAVLVCATELDGALVARGVQLIRDNDEAVRWKALVFIAKVPLLVLSASVSSQSDARLVELTIWTTRLNSEDVAEQVIDRLNSPDSLDRLIACAAAYRLHKLEPELLQLASESKNLEVMSFATEQLKLL